MAIQNLGNTVYYRTYPPHQCHAHGPACWLSNPIEECAAIKEHQLPMYRGGGEGADGAAANLFVYKKTPPTVRSRSPMLCPKPKPCYIELLLD